MPPDSTGAGCTAVGVGGSGAGGAGFMTGISSGVGAGFTTGVLTGDRGTTTVKLPSSPFTSTVYTAASRRLTIE
ncbi:hypothetical protein ACFLYV_02635 [Chloroflexota bacterium]